MTEQASGAARAAGVSAPRWGGLAALAAGIISLALMVVFFAVANGPAFLVASALCGVLAIVLGVVGLRMRRRDGAAITGIVLGSICALFGLAIFVFALIFVGALSF